MGQELTLLSALTFGHVDERKAGSLAAGCPSMSREVSETWRHLVDVAVHELFVWCELDGVDKCFLLAVGAKAAPSGLRRRRVCSFGGRG